MVNNPTISTFAWKINAQNTTNKRNYQNASKTAPKYLSVR